MGLENTIKKRLVVIAGIYYPTPSPPGRCSKQYIDILKKDFDVTIVFIQSGLKMTNAPKVDGCTLISLFNLRFFLLAYFLNRVDTTNTKVSKWAFNLMALFMRALGRIQGFLLWPDNLRWFYKGAFKKLVKLDMENPIDYVLTVSTPFTAHLAGRKFKRRNPGIRWVTFTFDPRIHSSNGKQFFIFPRVKEMLDIRAEKSIYNESDYNYVVEAAFKNSIDIIGDSLNKSCPLPFMIEEIDSGGIDYFDRSKINLVFAGTFYKDIRNPEYLLKTFVGIENMEMLLHLYSSGDCNALIKHYIGLSNGRIILHKPVSVDQVQKIMKNANFLINVGNSVAEFNPSKIAEYISTGKPVINFYKNNKIDELLLKYPLSLQIDTDRTEITESALKISAFCEANNHKVIPWEIIAKNYPQHTREYAKKLLREGFRCLG